MFTVDQKYQVLYVAYSGVLLHGESGRLTVPESAIVDIRVKGNSIRITTRKGKRREHQEFAFTRRRS